MVNEDKLNQLKERIDTAKTSNTPPQKQKKQSGAGFGFKISTEIIAALVVGVGTVSYTHLTLPTTPYV